jgi:SAM-dependent methyltransferase
VLLWDYERILTDVLAKSKNPDFKRKSVIEFYKEKLKRKLGIAKITNHNIWTKEYDTFDYAGEVKTTVAYQPVNTNNDALNRILDNSARELYKPAIDFFFTNFPDLIAKKIPAANVQQGFVFNTAVNLAAKFSNPKLLSVGAFEDTAAEGLKLLNYDIDFIDPVLNYDLETFLSKPTVKKASYDVIISTSVIEHVEFDEKFVQDIAYLLKKGGYAILTCDYKDQYKKGDEIPDVDYRFYTQHDLKVRLMGTIPDCKLFDSPDWDCENPDFYYGSIYNYTFATLVFYKYK